MSDAASQTASPSSSEPVPASVTRRGPDRSGRYYDDFVVGDIYEHHPGRTLSEADNTWFTLLTLNTHPLHFDVEYAKGTEFGRCIVCSPLTLAVLVGMSVRDVSQHAIANLGWDRIAMTHPVFPGDTLYAATEVLAKRPSKSRPTAGLVSVRTTGTQQHGTVVCRFERTFLVGRRPA